MKKYLDPDTVVQEIEDIIDYYSDDEGIVDIEDDSFFDELNDVLDRPMIICYPDHLYLSGYLMIKVMIDRIVNVQCLEMAQYINSLLEDMYHWIREADESKVATLFDYLMDELPGDEELALNLLMRDFLSDEHQEALIDYLSTEIQFLEDEADEGEVIESSLMRYLLMLLERNDYDVVSFMQQHFDFVECRLGLAGYLIEEGNIDLAHEILSDLSLEPLSQESYRRLLKLKVLLEKH